MSFKIFLDKVLSALPPQIRTLILGSMALGLFLTPSLAVAGEKFEIPESWLKWVAVAVAAVFSLLLCLNIRKKLDRCVYFVAGCILILAVGLTSNNVVAGIIGGSPVSGQAPPPPPPLSQIDPGSL